MKWHHSLYWRIAVGFVGCLALLLVVQAVLFIWIVSRSNVSQPPERLAQSIAVDVSEALARTPSLDIDAYLRQEYSRDAPPFFVLLADGRSIEIGGPFPPGSRRMAQSSLDMAMRGERGRGLFVGRSGTLETFERPMLPPPGPPPRIEPFPGEPMLPDMDAPNRGGRFLGSRRPFIRASIILSAGKPFGVVLVPPQPPFAFLLQRYGPVLSVAAAATLIVGTLLASVMIFGPTRTRLRAVEDAARRLGSGDLNARAPSGGRDEVAAVATAFNAMAADLSARDEALKTSDRVRRQLLADVSHELTTPVTAMRGYLETLSMQELGLDDATRGRYLGIIADETGRLERIIGDLLDLARLEGGGGSLASDEVPVDQLFDRVQARHERALRDAGVTIAVRIAADARVLRGDRDRLEQALQNLAANALRYAPSGSTIDLIARRAGEDIALEVADAGAGIPPEHLPHVFDRFYKVEESRAVRQGSGGSGLGLSIVKAIVERHGGTVTVRSEPGRTVFAMQLPQCPAAHKTS